MSDSKTRPRLVAAAVALALSLSLAPTKGTMGLASPFAAGAAHAAEGRRGDKGRSHYSTGTAYFRLDRFADALQEFEQGYLERQDPAFLFNIAQCHRELHHTAEAIRFYRRFLDEAPPSHPSRGDAEQALRELEGPAGAVGPAGTSPSGASALPPYALPPSSSPSSTGPRETAVVVPLSSPPPARSASAQPLPAAAPPAASAGPGTVGVTATAPAAGPADGAAPAKPIYKKWWFWTLIGAGVVGGILVGVAATSGNTPLCPAGRMCF